MKALKIFLFSIGLLMFASCQKGDLVAPNIYLSDLGPNEYWVTADPGMPGNTAYGAAVTGDFFTGKYNPDGTRMYVHGAFGYGGTGDDMKRIIHNKWTEVCDYYFQAHHYNPGADAFFIKVTGTGDACFPYVVSGINGYKIW